MCMLSNKIIHRMKIAEKISLTLIVIILFFLTPLNAQGNEAKAEKEVPVDVKEVVFSHMSDAYEWHITTWNGHHVSLYLPCIIKHHDGGWEIFSSKRLHHGHHYKGFYIDNERKGKIYEEGYEDRPWDISITRNVLQIWINVGIMLLIFIPAARWYKKRDVCKEAPKGFVGAIEMLTMSIHDDVIKACIGEKHYKPYASYLLTVFFFILVTNLIGLLPIFPGGSNITGNINITFFLAIATFLIVNLFGSKHYWKEIFWPDVPMLIKFPIPLMPLVEIIGIFTKPFALMVRLFANMFGGHTIILSLTCLIFITFGISKQMGTSMTVVSFIMLLFMNCMEVLVAFIQAYIFTMLSSIFIGLAHPDHEAE